MDLQAEKQYSFNSVTLLGMEMLVTFVHSSNAYSPMEVTPSEIVIFLIFVRWLYHGASPGE